MHKAMKTNQLNIFIFNLIIIQEATRKETSNRKPPNPAKKLLLINKCITEAVYTLLYVKSYATVQRSPYTSLQLKNTYKLCHLIK